MLHPRLNLSNLHTRDSANLSMVLLLNNQLTSINHILGILINNLSNPSTVQLILVFQEDIIFLMKILFQVILNILLLGMV